MIILIKMFGIANIYLKDRQDPGGGRGKER